MTQRVGSLAVVVLLGLTSCDLIGVQDPPELVGQWFVSCGDPVCSGNSNPAGLPACDASVKAGGVCTTLNAACDFGDACNQRMLCTTSDPTTSGCPRSRRDLKSDIHYLSAEEQASMAKALRSVRLATYRYTAQGPNAPTRLGFIIDDQPQSPAVDAQRDMVDLYGYLSMSVATLQTQAREIEVLKAELTKMRKTVEDMKR